MRLNLTLKGAGRELVVLEKPSATLKAKEKRSEEDIPQPLINQLIQYSGKIGALLRLQLRWTGFAFAVPNI